MCCVKYSFQCPVFVFTSRDRALIYRKYKEKFTTFMFLADVEPGLVIALNLNWFWHLFELHFLFLISIIQLQNFIIIDDENNCHLALNGTHGIYKRHRHNLWLISSTTIITIYFHEVQLSVWICVFHFIRIVPKETWQLHKAS